jgi:hypothetical protein
VCGEIDVKIHAFLTLAEGSALSASLPVRFILCEGDVNTHRYPWDSSLQIPTFFAFPLPSVFLILVPYYLTIPHYEALLYEIFFIILLLRLFPT